MVARWMRWMGVLLFFFTASEALAYTPHGWLWGDAFHKSEPLSEEKNVDFNTLNPDEQVAILRTYTLQAIHQMDIDPTPRHAKMAAEWLQFWSGKATGVMQSYRQMLLENPQLDYHLKHPTESAALSVTQKMEKEKEERAIAELSKQYGIFYFYQGRDPYEPALSPIIEHFSEHYHVAVIPVSVDGISDDVFPNGRVDSGQAAHLGVKNFPALILVSPDLQKSQPLNYGFITEEALVKRFYQVATHFKGED